MSFPQGLSAQVVALCSFREIRDVFQATALTSTNKLQRFATTEKRPAASPDILSGKHIGVLALINIVSDELTLAVTALNLGH